MAAVKKSKRAEFADDVQASTGGEIKRILPSHIRADHTTNTSRWACYDTPEELRAHLGDKCCFTLEQIEQRLKSLLSEGQIEDVTVAMSGTGHPDLIVGFLRHAAFLLAEIRGQLDSIPGAKGMKFAGIRAKVVPQPKSQSDWADVARRNLAENRERQDMSPVDLAFYLKRRLDAFDDNGVTLTRPAVAAEVGLAPRTVDKYLQLLSLKPPTLLAVHRGEMKMSAALKSASEKGEGTARGQNPGVRRAAMRRRDPDKRPKAVLTGEQLDALIDVINGDKTIADVDKHVAAWVQYMDAPPQPKEPSKPKKQSPPKPGKKETK